MSCKSIHGYITTLFMCFQLTSMNMPSDDSNVDEISFSKKVDSEGRLVIPQAHRRALGIDDEEAIVEFNARVLTVFDDEERTDEDKEDNSETNLLMVGPSAAAAWAAGKVCTVSQRAVKTYVAAKHTGLATDPRHPYYPFNQMPLHRKMGLLGSYVVMLLAASILTYWTGDLAAIANGDAFTIVGMIFGLLLGFIVLNWSLPPTDGSQQLSEQAV